MLELFMVSSLFMKMFIYELTCINDLLYSRRSTHFVLVRWRNNGCSSAVLTQTPSDVLVTVNLTVTPPRSSCCCGDLAISSIITTRAASLERRWWHNATQTQCLRINYCFLSDAHNMEKLFFFCVCVMGEKWNGLHVDLNMNTCMTQVQLLNKDGTGPSDWPTQINQINQLDNCCCSQWHIHLHSTEVPLPGIFITSPERSEAIWAVAEYKNEKSVTTYYPISPPTSTVVVLHMETELRLYWRLFKGKGWASKLNRCSHKANTMVRCPTSVSVRRWR